MRIAYLSNSVVPSNSANSIHVVHMCQALADWGHSVDLVAQRGASGEEPFGGYGVDGGFRIRAFAKGRSRLARVLIAVRSGLFALGHDFVIGRSLNACAVAAAVGVPTLFEAHEPLALGELRILRIMARRRSFRGLVVITHKLADWYAGAVTELAGKIFVFPDGATPITRTLANRIAPVDGKLQVGYVGNLYPGKGLELIAKLAPLCQWAMFHIVGGDGELLADWQRRLSPLTNVEFYGRVPHRDTGEYISSFDVVVLPNGRVVESRDGKNISEWTSPLKLFEYMAVGKPIVCSRLPALCEIITEGLNGLLCDPDNTQEWVDALLRLRDHPDLRLKLGEHARRDLEQKYSWRARAGAIVSAASCRQVQTLISRGKWRQLIMSYMDRRSQ